MDPEEVLSRFEGGELLRVARAHDTEECRSGFSTSSQKGGSQMKHRGITIHKRGSHLDPHERIASMGGDTWTLSEDDATQRFNTTTSMGRLILNILLSFAQLEREVTGERIRDKIAASKRKGMWMGGRVPLG
jgi:Resolvase, N terminal domain